MVLGATANVIYQDICRFVAYQDQASAELGFFNLVFSSLRED